MTWTYFPSQLSTKPIYLVRLLIGDTLRSDQQLQDEEIAAFIAQRSTAYGAAAMACRTLAAQYGRSVDRQAGNSSAKYSQLSQAYAKQAIQFEAQAAMSGSAVPVVGGISIRDKITQEQDGDRTPPQFQIGMEDNRLPIGPVGPESEEMVGPAGEDVL